MLNLVYGTRENFARISGNANQIYPKARPNGTGWLTDPNQNADTFYGNYGRIISAIKEVQPKAKIFMLTMATEGDAHRGAYNTAIQEIATLFDNCYIIPFSNTDLYEPTIYNNRRVGHFNAVGYQAMSLVIERYANEIMLDNWEDFRTIEFIGTEYDYSFD